MAGPSRHQVAWVAAGLRRAAGSAGVDLPVDYAKTLAADGLGQEGQLGITRLGAGVVIHTAPASSERLPVVLGYADGEGQWYRDGHRHGQLAPCSAAAEPEPVSVGDAEL